MTSMQRIVDRWLISIMLLFMIWTVAFAQVSEEAVVPVLKSNYEIGLTPRWRYFSYKDAAPGGGDMYVMQWAPRIQVATEVYNNSYVILFYDWMARRTDDSDFYGKNYDGHKFGVQLSYKFLNAYIEHYLFKLKNRKKTYLRLYPEIMVATGLSNLSSLRYAHDLVAGNGYYHIYEFTVGFNIVLNRYLNLQFYRGVGWEPHERHYPYKQYSFIKFIYKV